MSVAPSLLLFLSLFSLGSAWGSGPSKSAKPEYLDAFAKANRSHLEALRHANDAIANLAKQSHQVDQLARNDTAKKAQAKEAQEKAGAKADRRTVLKSVRQAEADAKAKLREAEKQARMSIREVRSTARAIRDAARKSNANDTDVYYQKAKETVDAMEQHSDRLKDDGLDSAERVSQDVQDLVDRSFENQHRAEQRNEEKKERAQQRAEEKKERAAEEKRRAERREREEKERAEQEKRRAAQKKAREDASNSTAHSSDKPAATISMAELSVEGGESPVDARLWRLATYLTVALAAFVAIFAVLKMYRQRQTTIRESPLLG